jgi:uncharacterized membrane protein
MRLRNIIMLMTVFTITAIIFVGATIRTDGHKINKDSEGEETEGFRLSACVENKQFKAGEPVALKLTIRNVTDQTLYLIETFPEREYKIVVKNEAGESVPLTAAGVRLANGDDSRVIGVKLEPKEARQDSIEVTKFYEMATPGTYSITASRTVKNRRGRGWSEAVSNIVKVTITC